MATKGRDFKSCKLKKEEYDTLNVMEKRIYNLQDDEYETMWWSRTASKFIVIFGIISIIAGIIIASNK